MHCLMIVNEHPVSKLPHPSDKDKEVINHLENLGWIVTLSTKARECSDAYDIVLHD